MTFPTETNTAYADIIDTIEPFELHELNAVLFLARRLAMGREKYGPLNPFDGRNWAVERAEELADALVYEYAMEVGR